MKSPAQLLSLRAYARHRGVALNAVRKAIESGRIKPDKNGKIDPEKCDDEWAKNTRPSAAPGTLVKRAAGLKAKKIPAGKSATGASAFAQSRAQVEKYKARMARLNYEERSNKLVRREEVEAAAFQTFRNLRDRLLTVPDRIAAQLAAEAEERVVHKILVDEIRKALQEFADGDNH